MAIMNESKKKFYNKLFLKYFCIMYLIQMVLLVYVAPSYQKIYYGNTESTILDRLSYKILPLQVLIFITAFCSINWYFVWDELIDSNKKIKSFCWFMAGIFMWKLLGISICKLWEININQSVGETWANSYLVFSDRLWKDISIIYIFPIFLKNLSRLLRNKSAVLIAFDYDIFYSIFPIGVIGIYFNYPFSGVYKISEMDIITNVSIAWIIFWGLQLAVYVRYASVFENKKANYPLSICIVIDNSCVNTPWSVKITKKICKEIKQLNCWITVIQQNEDMLQNSWKDVIFIYAGLEEKFFDKLVEKTNAFMFYHYIYDSVVRPDQKQQRKLYEKQLDVRTVVCVSSSLGNMLREVVSHEAEWQFRRKLDDIINQKNWKKLYMGMFSEVILRGLNDLMGRTSTFSLADLIIKYIESLNHCITLVLFNLKDISLNIIMNNKNTEEKITQGTFGSWKDLRRVILKTYKEDTEDFYYLQYQKILESRADPGIVKDITFIMQEFKESNQTVISNDELIADLVIFRNYTRGHGIYTYDFSKELIYAMMRISVYISSLLEALQEICSIDKLSQLGWTYHLENREFYLYSYDRRRMEYECIDYVSNQIIGIAGDELECNKNQ